MHWLYTFPGIFLVGSYLGDGYGEVSGARCSRSSIWPAMSQCWGNALPSARNIEPVRYPGKTQSISCFIIPLRILHSFLMRMNLKLNFIQTSKSTVKVLVPQSLLYIPVGMLNCHFPTQLVQLSGDLKSPLFPPLLCAVLVERIRVNHFAGADQSELLCSVWKRCTAKREKSVDFKSLDRWSGSMGTDSSASL